MGRQQPRTGSWRHRVGAISVASLAVLGAAACSSNSSTSTTTGAAGSSQTPPTASQTPPTSVGKGEGQLNLIAWEGYAQPQWVKPFEKQTGCQVHAKYAGSSGEMVSLMANGGGGQYDMVSASGDADLRLIYGGDVKPVNVKLVPGLAAVPSVPQGTGLQHDRRGPLRDESPVRPQRPAVLHQDVPDRSHQLERDLRRQVQGSDHRAEQPDPDRRTPPCTSRRRSRASASPILTS